MIGREKCRNCIWHGIDWFILSGSHFCLPLWHVSGVLVLKSRNEDNRIWISVYYVTGMYLKIFMGHKRVWKFDKD